MAVSKVFIPVLGALLICFVRKKYSFNQSVYPTIYWYLPPRKDIDLSRPRLLLRCLCLVVLYRRLSIHPGFKYAYVVKYTLCDIQNILKRRLSMRLFWVAFLTLAGICTYLRPIFARMLFSARIRVFILLMLIIAFCGLLSVF